MSDFNPKELEWFNEHELYSSWDRQIMRHRAVLDLLGDRPLTTFLDVGCGRGDLLPMLVSKYDVSRYFGVDICERFIEDAVVRYDHMKCSNFKVGTVDELRGVDRFDATVAVGMFSKRFGSREQWRKSVIHTLLKMWELTAVVMLFDIQSSNMWKIPEGDEVMSPGELVGLMSSLDWFGSEKFQLRRVEPNYVNMVAVYR